MELEKIVVDATGVVTAAAKRLKRNLDLQAAVKASLLGVPSGTTNDGSAQQPVYVSVNAPAPVVHVAPAVNHVHVPEQPSPARTKRIISYGTDRTGEPTVEITEQPVDQ